MLTSRLQTLRRTDRWSECCNIYNKSNIIAFWIPCRYILILSWIIRLPQDNVHADKVWKLKICMLNKMIFHQETPGFVWFGSDYALTFLFLWYDVWNLLCPTWKLNENVLQFVTKNVKKTIYNSEIATSCFCNVSFIYYYVCAQI